MLARVSVHPEAPRLGLGAELDVRVAQKRGGLSGNDERILAFVREHLSELAFHTAESLAQGAGVSAAAVVRFTHRLGFASFRELRDRARDELQGARSEDRAAAPAASALGRKVERDIASLQLLPRLLDEPLEAAAAVIAGARTTWVLANRETHGLAVYVQRLMHHFREDVRLVDPSFADGLRSLGPEDVMLACTFRPYARLTLDLLRQARHAGARIVVVTDGRAHDFLAPSDIVLAVPVESPTLLLSFTPAVCVLEALAGRVAMMDADRTHDLLEATGRFLDDHELVVDRLATPPRRGAAGRARRTR
jgi:DNA-binding MurR/RpiR family transcriptional regulator